ncbi:hypothetical protein ALISP_4398 [Alicycliphilus sp. B1]|nr:hypothetical protein ALISP_4398 [Alicycliphilus sp. B1]
MAQVVARQAHDYRQPRRCGEYGIKRGVLLGCVEGGGFARGAARDHAGNTAGAQPLHQGAQRRVVDGAVAIEWRDEGNPQAGEPGGGVGGRHGFSSFQGQATGK